MNMQSSTRVVCVHYFARLLVLRRYSVSITYPWSDGLHMVVTGLTEAKLSGIYIVQPTICVKKLIMSSESDTGRGFNWRGALDGVYAGTRYPKNR